jgi:hypothetical protein
LIDEKKKKEKENLNIKKSMMNKHTYLIHSLFRVK